MMTPLNTDPTQYPTEGYCLFPNVLPPEVVSHYLQELEVLIAAMPAKITVYMDGEYKEVDARTEYLDEPHSTSSVWLELCRRPHILDAVESILGKDLILIMSQLIVKAPDDGLAVAWHQDNTYWHTIQGTDVGTVWLALDDTDRENSSMKVIANSHAGFNELPKIKTDGSDLLGLKVEVSAEMEQSAQYLEMKAGSLSIHDSYIVHGSDRNVSGRRRAAFTMRYANALTTEVNVHEHWVPIYLVRGSGGPQAAEYVDIRPGKPLPARP